MVNTSSIGTLETTKPTKTNSNLSLNALDKFKFLATMIHTMLHLKSVNKLRLLSSCGFFEPNTQREIILTLKLPTELIINHVEELHGQIYALMDSGEDVVLDISEVGKADTACLQLFCVVQKSLIGIGHQIAWQGTSEPLTTTAKCIGVNEFLKL